MPRLLLAIDTTSVWGSLAVVSEEELAQEMSLYSEDGFSQSLFFHLENFLKRIGVTLDEIDAYAGLSGPGSFTGVRVCLAAVKGLAEARGKSAFGISNLQAIATFGETNFRAAFLDARRGEIFGAVYDRDCGIVQSERVTPLANWLRELPDDAELITTDFTPYLAALKGDRLENARRTQAPRALAGAAGHLALKKLLAGESGTSLALDANYVRRSDAELKWRDRS